MSDDRITNTRMSDQMRMDRGIWDARVGQSRHDLSTPSLLLDLDVFEVNLKKMAEHSKSTGIGLRPHAKSHKCPEVALRQIGAGALGVCAATIDEAEALSRAGVKGILITSEMVGRRKIERLLTLSKTDTEVMSVVDNLSHLDDLNQAGQAAGVTLSVLIDMDLGLKRTGVAGIETGMALAERICALPSLRLRGISAYSSLSAHVIGYVERRAHSFQSMEPAIELLSRMRRVGMPAEILTGGSTGTYNIDSDIEAMTELQAGSYIFMDVDYQMIGGKGGPSFNDFGFSLTVLATVISKSHAGFATVDAGFKAFATDRPFGPELKGRSGLKYHFGGDEHGILEIEDGDDDLRLGDRLEFIVPHCDPTVNLYDHLYCVRGDRIEAVWPICRGYN
jgi:D-serine deaminase-like pyridoxal phosphate-dependent protein